MSKLVLDDFSQWRGEVREGLPDWSHSEKSKVGDELSDVLIYLIELAAKCHIDLPEAVLKKFQKNAEKYPAKQVFGDMRKYTEYHK